MNICIVLHLDQVRLNGLSIGLDIEDTLSKNFAWHAIPQIGSQIEVSEVGGCSEYFTVTRVIHFLENGVVEVWCDDPKQFLADPQSAKFFCEALVRSGWSTEINWSD